jgi:D-beta-D-heptose 7-phosphate kinase/D-beta-D-heptose 1-phosphate adenosyltransferase
MLIDDFSKRKLLVVGDVMLDHFIGGIVERVSPEAPALVLRIEEERSMLGGAANVAANIASLGATAVIVGAIGKDPAGEKVSALCREHRERVVDALVSSDRCRTTQKTRYIAGDRHLLRADREDIGLTDDLQQIIIETIIDRIESCDAVVISDYAKGVVSAAVVEAAVREAQSRRIPVIADPKRRAFRLYAGADVLTPNAKELEFATGEPCHDLSSCERAAREVMKLTRASVLLTRSEHGVAVYQPNTEPWSEAAHAIAVRDVSGAGDTILAACALALAAGATLVDAAHVANVAAAVAVGKSGTAWVTRDELSFALMHSPDMTTLAGKLVVLSSAVSIRELWRSQGLDVGFTNGCFDLLHPGHIRLLTEARAACDRLIVALNSDASVRRLKGPERPVQTELARAAVIGAVRSVDLVLLFDEDTPLEMISELTPDVLIKGADYTVETVVGADLIQNWGGRVELIELVPGASSSNLIETSRNSAGNPVGPLATSSVTAASYRTRDTGV